MAVVPAWQVHWPPTQSWRAAQAVPQVPQWVGLVSGSMQVPAQRSCPAAQPHTPAWQSCPSGQATPQLPQLAGLF
jgi:hypothetical protein